MNKVSSKFDWVAYTDRIHQPEEIMAFYAPYFVEFVARESGRYFYRQGASAPGINIYWDNKTPDAEDTVMVEISGTGCDLLYNMGFDLNRHLKDIRAAGSDYHVNRLDPCLDFFADDEVDFFPYDKLVDRANSYSFVCPVHKNARSIRFASAAGFENTYGMPGTTCYFGAAGSDCRLTTYNKLLERKAKCKKNQTPDLPDVFDGRELKEWIRFEYRLRNESAEGFLDLLIKHNKTMTETILGLLKRYITFVDDDRDSDKRLRKERSVICQWWSDFLENVHELFIMRTSHNISPDQTIEHVKRNARSLGEFVDLCGEEALYELVVWGRANYRAKNKIRLNMAKLIECGFDSDLIQKSLNAG